MRNSEDEPIVEIRLPPEVPHAVARGRDRLAQLTGELMQTRGELREAEQEIDPACRADLEAQGELLAAGRKAPADPNKREREARARVAILTNRVGALEAACDHAGTTLAEAIEQARDAWLERLRAAEVAAREAFVSAAREAGELLDHLAAQLEVIPWLEAFAGWKLERSDRSAQFVRSLPEDVMAAYSGLAGLHRVSCQPVARVDPPVAKAPAAESTFEDIDAAARRRRTRLAAGAEAVEPEQPEETPLNSEVSREFSEQTS